MVILVKIDYFTTDDSSLFAFRILISGTHYFQKDSDLLRFKNFFLRFYFTNEVIRNYIIHGIMAMLFIYFFVKAKGLCDGVKKSLNIYWASTPY